MDIFYLLCRRGIYNNSPNVEQDPQESGARMTTVQRRKDFLLQFQPRFLQEYGVQEA